MNLQNFSKTALAGIIAFLSLLIAACVDYDGSGSNFNYENFGYDLQGIWESNDKSVYSGRLEIDYNTITITGYEESQTPQQGNDSERPFKGFTKNAALQGYSEEGRLFINDAGVLQEGISYNYWFTERGYYYNADYRKEEFLRFDFGGRIETLQKTQEVR